MHFVLSSDLWKPLSATHGKCDGMVEGKYRKARVFAYETDNLYIWCNTETGDRGTTWLCADKEAEKLKESWRGGYSYADLLPQELAEITGFFEALVVDCALADPACAETLGGLTVVRAAMERQELGECVPSARPAPKRRM